VKIEDFYANLIHPGSEWTVMEVVSDEGKRRINVHLASSEAAQLQCPVCGADRPIFDFSLLKTWRHLDSCDKKTYLLAKLPIVNCPRHGRKIISPPWGKNDSPLTDSFIEYFYHLLKVFGDFSKAADFFQLDLVQTRHIRHLQKKSREDAVDGAQSDPSVPAAPRSIQPSLFDQGDMRFVNLGIHAFRKLELEEAVEFFEKHRKLYPKGFNVDARLSIAESLLKVINEAPSVALDRCAFLYRSWKSIERLAVVEHPEANAYLAEIKGAFFAGIADTIRQFPDGAASLPEDIMPGYIYLQAGRYEEAIRSFQESIAQKPAHALPYGYLGDAYMLRGELRIARQCYREGCLIEPAEIDWHSVQDKDLNELREGLLFIYGSDPDLAIAWLPSHARISGLFERKVVRLHDGRKELAAEYLTLGKETSGERSPITDAKLFFRGMVLCENQENLRFVKKIDITEVRRRMKKANPDLFDEFLEVLVGP